MSVSTIASVALVAILVIAGILLIVCTALTFIGEWKFFEKCGEKGWKALIPFYNDWTIIKISNCHSYYFFFIIGESILSLFAFSEIFEEFSIISSLFSFVSLYVILCINYNIAKKFHQEMGFAIGMTFVPFVFYIMLGLSNKYKYDKKVKVNPWGIYDFKERKSVVNTEKHYCSNCGMEMSSNFCPKCGMSKKGE